MFSSLRNLLASSTKVAVPSAQNSEGSIPMGVSGIGARATASGEIIWSKPNRNMLVVGGPRSGKTPAIGRPAALSYSGSLVVIETNGELFAQTAGYREQVFKQQIVYIDPDSEFSAGLNPLDFLDQDDAGLYSKASDIARIFMATGNRDTNTDSAFVRLMSQAAFRDIILFKVITRGDTKPSLVDVMEFLSGSPSELRDKFLDIEKSASKGAYGSHSTTIQENAANFISADDQMLSNIRATIQVAGGDIYRSGYLSKTTFNTRKLKTGEMSLFINAREEYASSNTSAFNVLVHTVFMILSEPKKCEALVLWDSLEYTGGTIELYEAILPLSHKYGYHIIGFMRSINDIRRSNDSLYFDRWLANSEYLVYCRGFQPDDVYLSKRLKAAWLADGSVCPEDRFVVFQPHSRETPASYLGKLAVKLPDGSYIENQWLRGKGTRFPFDAERDADGKPILPPVPASVIAVSLKAHEATTSDSETDAA